MKRLFLYLCMLGFSSGAAMAQDIRLPEKPNRPEYKDYSLAEKGYWYSVEAEAGSSVALKSRNLQVAGLSFTNGYRFCEFLKVGIGFGARHYFNNNDKVRQTDVKWTFPVYANFRGNMISQDVRTIVPYWSLNIGGVIRDGFFISPTVGLRFGEHRSSWLLGVSYSYNEMDAWPHKNTGKSFLLLRCGYEF